MINKERFSVSVLNCVMNSCMNGYLSAYNRWEWLFLEHMKTSLPSVQRQRESLMNKLRIFQFPLNPIFLLTHGLYEKLLFFTLRSSLSSLLRKIKLRRKFFTFWGWFFHNKVQLFWIKNFYSFCWKQFS